MDTNQIVYTVLSILRRLEFESATSLLSFGHYDLGVVTWVHVSIVRLSKSCIRREARTESAYQTHFECTVGEETDRFIV